MMTNIYNHNDKFQTSVLFSLWLYGMTKNAIIVLMCGSVASDERSLYF